MNRIKEWLEQDPKRMHFIKIGLVLLGIILLIALPTLYLVLSGVGIWYFVKKAPDIRKRNLMIGLFIVSFIAVALQTPTVTKKTSSSQSETKQTAISTTSTPSTPFPKTTAPVPMNTSINVPINSATNFFMISLLFSNYVLVYQKKERVSRKLTGKFFENHKMTS